MDTARYEIITPDPFHRGEFAGTPAGEWVVISNKRFDTADEAVAAIAQMMEQHLVAEDDESHDAIECRCFGTLAIRHVGYPEIDEFYTVDVIAEPESPFAFVEATKR